MAEPDLYYLSLTSVSAVLLGICVTVRNNAFSTILRHYDEEIQIGNRDYEPILERSAYGAMASGALLSITIVVAYVALSIGSEGNTNDPLFWLTNTLFGLGLLALVYSLFAGYVNLEWPFRAPSKPDRDERPELKDQN